MVVSTKENPVDDASRGVRVKDFIHDSVWIEDPKILRKPEMD